MRESNGHEDWKITMEKAEELLEQGRKEMAKAAEMAREKGEDALAAARKKGKEVWDEARASGLNVVDDLRDQGEEVWEDAAKLVKKHPARAIGLTLFVGVIIGVLLSKDKD
jgi:ElaB/YqjD/DUF883 family membrane-anchored ribosome-binding protein